MSRATALPDADKAMGWASDEVYAAYAIASDPNCNAGLAVRHLVAAWRWAYVSLEREPPPPEVSSLATWVRGQCERPCGKKRASAAGSFVEEYGAVTDPPQLESAALLEQLAALRDRVDAERRRSGAVPPARTKAALWGRRAAAWVGVGLLVFLVAMRPWQWEGVGPWHGSYYPGKDLRGDPDVRREANVDFEWGELPPTESIPSDRFAARWDTCLVLEEEVEASFQLIADDGARLFIDGEEVIDMWKPGDEELPWAKGATELLEPGVHHVRVEYHDDEEHAEVHLTASFDPEMPPGPIPARMLEYPGEEIDEDSPCRNVEGG